MKKIDLRSDVVTLPTPEMMQAIAEAELGDDVAGEDPTVNKLQELAARTFGTEAALLTTSGTQANLVAVLTHCRPGDEAIMEADAHLYYYEVGGLAAVAGVIPRLIKGDRGRFTAAQVQAAVRGENIHFPTSRLVEIENAHNRAGGTCWTPAQVAAVAGAAHDLGLKVHVDGARIFNAAVALDVSVKDYARHVDSMMFSLSKGLSCPIGSVLVGDSEFVEAARKKRKMLGGGMRQAGVIAAPGIVALNTMVPRLKEDHDNAKKLAEYLGVFNELKIDPATVQTNMVLADVSGTGMTAERFAAKAAEKGLLVSIFGPYLVRFVTHRGITAADVEQAAGMVEAMLPHCSGNVCTI